LWFPAHGAALAFVTLPQVFAVMPAGPWVWRFSRYWRSPRWPSAGPGRVRMR